MIKTIKITVLPVLLCLLSIGVFAQQPKQTSIVIVEFIKTKPGMYADAMKYYQAGWLKARVEAKKRKYIASYKLWTLGENAEGEWNIMLITEFADKQSFDAVEPNFKKVFAKVAPNDVTINGKTGDDLVTSVMIKKLNALPFDEKK
ncbi:MAG: hypothetical protein H7Z37_03930 [Pyrinomonadaceae bacterium]|nr:hypothetical protein [Pyrinomonadaceae bacterium]